MARGAAELQAVVSDDGGSTRLRSGEEREPPAGRIDLTFHGLGIAVLGDWPEVIEDLRADFTWFSASGDGPPDVIVEVVRTAPDFGIAGDIEASFVTPRNVVYEHDGGTLIDYFGRALSVYDRGRGRLLVQGQDRDLAAGAGD